MKIKDITYSNKNDFKAIFICTLCKREYESWGCSDSNFYTNILPNALCPKCGKNSFGESSEELKKRLGKVYRI